MDELELLTRLRDRIGPDLKPVRPLSAPGVRALWLLAVWVVLAAVITVTLGPRQDILTLGPWRSVGYSLVEIASSSTLVLVGFRFCIPAMSGSRWIALGWVVVALGLHVAISWVTLERSDLSPPHDMELRDGLACFAAIMILGLGPLVLGAVLLLRGLLTRYFLSFMLVGLASGLAAEATWRLHCPYSAWDHVLRFHSGAMLLFMLIASVIASFVRRST